MHSTKRIVSLFALLIFSFAFPRPLSSQTYLSADGQTDAYTLITSKLAPGANPIEVPDCGDPANAPHIRQTWNDDLGHYVFQFFIHLVQDDDPSTNPCNHGDRQRNEIKTYAPSPEYLKAYSGDTVTYRWKFRLDTAFQPSPNFTHIHQIKPVDGNDANPVISFIPVAGSPDIMQLRYYDDAYTLVKLKEVPLAPFRGTWVEASEKITFGTHGSYSMSLTKVSDGTVLMSYNNSDINLLRTDSTFYRPKWGIYRSLLKPEYLRDEVVLFDNFCLAKGADDCASPDFDLAATPPAATIAAGGSVALTANVTGKSGFNGKVTLSVSGLPAGATANLDQDFVIGSGHQQITIATTKALTPGSYKFSVIGVSGTVTHQTDVTLQVTPPPDFQLNVTPPSQKVIAGNSTFFTSDVIPSDGFNDPVTFGVSGHPVGATATFDPSSVNGTGSARLNVITSSSVAPGTYPLSVLATSGTLSHTALVSLAITGQPEFALALDPATQSVKSGQDAIYNIAVSPSNGFNSSVTFSCSGLPSSSRCVFLPASLTPDQSPVTSKLTISTAATTAENFKHYQAISLAFGLPLAFVLPLSIKRKKTARLWIASVLPLIVIALVTCGGGSGPQSSNPPPGGGSPQPQTYNFTVTATSGSLQHSATGSLTVAP